MAGLYDDTSGFSSGTGLYRGRLGLFSGASGLVNGTGSGGGAALPSDTVSEIWFGDAATYDYAAVRNLRASTSPTGNIFIYTSDQVRTQAGSPTITYNYDAAGGTRIQLTGAQSLTLMSASPPGSSTPVGQCTLGFQWMPTGGSTQIIRYGQTPYTAPTVPGATTSATGGTFTQASVTGTYSSADSVVITTLANSTVAAAPTGAVRDAFGVTTFTTTTAHSMIAGQSVVVSGVTDTTFNTTFTIAAAGVPGASRTSNVTTFTTTTTHGIAAGQTVDVAGVTDTTFNGTFTVLASPAPTSTTFAVTNAGSNGTSGAGSATRPTVISNVTSTTFTVPNAGAVATSGSGSVAKPVDIIVKELQMYRGSSIPAYSTENWDYHFKSNWAIPNALSTTGQALNNVAPAVSRGAIVFPSRTTYSEITVFVMANKSSLVTSNSALLTPIYDPDTGAVVGSSDFNMASKATLGTFYASPESALRESGQITMQDAGVQIYAFRGSTAQATTYLNELQSMQTEAGTGGWPAVPLRGLWLGSYSATRNQSPTGSLFDGSYYMFAMVPRALSDAEMLSAMSYIRTEATSRGITLSTLSDITITPGDSLTEWIATPSWPWVLAADATISPRMQLKNCANGGSSFNGITIGQPEAFGTVLTTEVIPAVQACDAMGTTPIVLLMDGANDYAYLSTLAGSAPPGAVPGWNNALTGYVNYQNIWWVPYMEAIRAASPNVKIIGIDTMPRGDTAATNVNFETTGRGPWNTWKRANYATYCDAYVSTVGTTLETFAGADAAGYFSVDNLHLSATGQAYLASLIKPVWQSVR